MNDYEQHDGTHLCLLQWSCAYFYVLLFLSNKRKFEELFFLEIALELFLWSAFTLDSVPRASEKFPLLIVRNAFWLLPPSVLTLVQSSVHCHGKYNITFKIFICRLKIPIVASHSLNQDITETITWPVIGAQPVFNAAFAHTVHEELTDPSTLPEAFAGSKISCCDSFSCHSGQAWVVLQLRYLLGARRSWSASAGCF